MIVYAPFAGGLAEECDMAGALEGLLDVDAVVGVGVKKMLPARDHCFGAGEAVAARVGEGVVLSHEGSQGIQVCGVDGGDEGEGGGF